MEPSALVGVAFGAIPENAAINGRSRNVHESEPLQDRLVQRLALPLVGFAHVDAHQPRRPLHLLVWRLGRGRSFLIGDPHDMCIVDLDYAIVDHVIKRRHELIHLLGGLDEFYAYRQVLSQDFDLRRMHHSMRAEASHCSRGCRASDAFVQQERQNGVREGTEVVLGILVDEYRDLLG